MSGLWLNVEVKASRHGGLGLFSTKNLKKGDAVLAERAFLEVKGLTWESDEAALDPSSRSSKLICDAVRRLPAVDTQKFWSFTQASVYGEVASAQGVFWTNMIDLQLDDEDDTWSMMFELTCRLNHSCAPNVAWRTPQYTGQLVTVATKDVSQGEELTVDYCETMREKDTPYMIRKENVACGAGMSVRDYLFHWYGFNCNCGACDCRSDYISPNVDGKGSDILTNT